MTSGLYLRSGSEAVANSKVWAVINWGFRQRQQRAHEQLFEWTCSLARGRLAINPPASKICVLSSAEFNTCFFISISFAKEHAEIKIKA